MKVFATTDIHVIKLFLHDIMSVCLHQVIMVPDPAVAMLVIGFG